VATDTTRPRLVALRGSTGRVGRPSEEADADAALMEAASLREDMRAAAARLRWVVLTSLWAEPKPRRTVLRIAERLEAQAAGSEGAA